MYYFALKTEREVEFASLTNLFLKDSCLFFHILLARTGKSTSLIFP